MFECNIFFQEAIYVKQVEELKDDVKRLIHAETDVLAKLELLDSIQRLGLKYQFQEDLKQAVDVIYNNNSADAWLRDDLYTTALKFRILWDYGFTVEQGSSCFTL